MEINAKREGPNFWLAVCFIALGLLFLLDNLNIIDIGSVFSFWPLIIIGIGVVKLRGGRADRTSAFFFIGVGVMFLLTSHDILDWDDVWQFWPLALIAIGLSIIFGRSQASMAGEEISADERVDLVAMFSGNHKIITNQNFRGGNVTALFGGVKLDLARAQLAKGENYLEIFAMFGGAEIYVPRDWKIILKGVPVFGGFEDGRSSVVSDEQVTDRTLVIKGYVVFGGLELKNYPHT